MKLLPITQSIIEMKMRKMFSRFFLISVWYLMILILGVQSAPNNSPVQKSLFRQKRQSLGVCGIANGPGADPNKGTIQNTPTNINDFPWVTFFYYDNSPEDIPFWCTGSIIGKKWILTAASCNLTLERGVDNPILGFIGVFNADNFENFASKLRIPLAGLVAEVITHPQWNPTTRNADIAIVRLINDIVYTNITRPVCLPNLVDSDPVNGAVTLNGWGTIAAEDDYFDSNSIARKASAKIISNAQCQLTNKAVTTDKICIVGDPSGSMCVGDSGGPVNYKNADGTWTTIGIVAYENYLGGCRNDSLTPRSFTRVSSYVEWICSITKDCPLPTLSPLWTSSTASSSTRPSSSSSFTTDLSNYTTTISNATSMAPSSSSSITTLMPNQTTTSPEPSSLSPLSTSTIISTSVLPSSASSMTASSIIITSTDPFSLTSTTSSPVTSSPINSSSTQLDSTSTASPITTPQSDKVNSTSAFSSPVTDPFSRCGRANTFRGKEPGADPSNPDIQSMVAHEFPWLAFFYFGNSTESKVWCTGSIIAPKWIMTAASCMDEHRNTGKLHGYIGVHSRDPALSIPERIPIDDLIDRFFLHPQWNESKMNADIALIRLKKDIEYSKYITPICLPNPTDPYLVDGTITLAGWGESKKEGDSSGSTSLSYTPRKAPATIVNNSLCEQMDNRTTSDNICIVGDVSGSSCVGEPGGPLNFKNPDNSWMVIGVVSYEHFLGGCQNDSSIPRPFTRIRPYVNWINCMIDDKSNSSCTNDSITTNTSPMTPSSSKPATSWTTQSSSFSTADPWKSSTSLSPDTNSSSTSPSSASPLSTTLFTESSFSTSSDPMKSSSLTPNSTSQITPITSGGPSTTESASTTKGPDECGRANFIGLNPFSYSVNMMVLSEFPWLTYLYFGTSNNSSLKFWCSGSIIGTKWILTAASCFDAYRAGDSLNGYIRVHSVAIDSNDDNNRIPIKDLIDKIIIHPQWNRTTRNSDIALIRLKKDFPYENTIKPICLPNSADPEHIGDDVTLSGWGTIQVEGKGFENDNFPRKTNAKVVNNSDCKTSNNMVTTGNICVAGDSSGSLCVGDTGGPVSFRNVDGTYTAIGIVSYENYLSGCRNLTSSPRTFTRVSSYVEWISCVMTSVSDDTICPVISTSAGPSTASLTTTQSATYSSSSDHFDSTSMAPFSSSSTSPTSAGPLTSSWTTESLASSANTDSYSSTAVSYNRSSSLPSQPMPSSTSPVTFSPRVRSTRIPYSSCGIDNPVETNDPKNGKIQVMAKSEFPWLVYLYFDNTGEDKVRCSGSVIEDRWILTAASCLDVYRKSNKLYGFIGAHSIDLKIFPKNRISIENITDQIIIHPNWNQTTRNADVALIRLKGGIPFNYYVRPICLPKSTDRELINVSVTLAGWGEAAFEGDLESANSLIPRKANAAIVSNSQCEATNSSVTSSNICIVGDPSGSICVAEPGGSVSFRNAQDSWTAIGIVTYETIDSCRNGSSKTPKTFTRVTSYVDWIECVMSGETITSCSDDFIKANTSPITPSSSKPATSWTTQSFSPTTADPLNSSTLNYSSSSPTPSSASSSASSSPITLPTTASPVTGSPINSSSTQSDLPSTASPITTPQSDKVNSTSSAPTTPAPIGLCGRANGEGANPNYPDIQSMANSEFPWLAFFYFGNSFEDKVWCTGSIISSNWIMTAASCMDEHRNTGKLHGFIGVHNMDPQLKKVPRRRIPFDDLIDHFVLHPEWNEAQMNADIALIRLKISVPYSKYVTPICLPKPTDPYLVDGIVTLAGWGEAGYEGDNGTTSLSYIPRKAPAKIVDNSLCEKMDNRTTDGNICIVGDVSGSSCVGEPGGPLNFKNPDNSWMAIGVVSYEHFLGGCQNASTIPRSFTRIRPYVNWINCMIDDKSNSSCTNESITTNTSPMSMSSTASSAFTTADPLNSTSSSPLSSSSTSSTNVSTTESVSSTKVYDNCGKANGPGANPSERNVQRMSRNELPWLAYLFFDNSNDETALWCSGSIISSKWILTAASCLDDNRKSGKLLGFLGVHRLGWKSKGRIVIKNLTDQIIIHPQWNRTTRNADIALIRLNIDVPFTYYTRPVCLPNSADPERINGTVTIAGWGTLPGESTGYENNGVPRKAAAKIVTNSECQQTSNNSNICIVGDSSASSCVGEPGGPVNYKNPDGTWTTVGIVSYDHFLGCRNEPSTPRPFTRVSSYLEWINNHIVN